MNFKDCILEHVKSKRLSAAAGQTLLDKFEKLQDQYTKSGQGIGAAEKAAQDLIQREVNEKVAKARNLRTHALKVKEINDQIDSKSGNIYSKVADVYQRAAFRGESVRATVYSFMDSVADKIKGNFLNLSRDHALFEKGVRSAMGEAVEDVDAVNIGKVIRESFDYLHSRYRSAGGIVGTLDNYYPQVHRAEAIRKMPKKDWINFVEQRADLTKMIDERTGVPFTPEALRSSLDSIYDDIITDGRASIKKDLEKGKVSRGGTSLEQRRNLTRFIHFKNVDSFVEYNAKFGTGENGLINSFLDSIDSYSRDIGTLEVLGPRPDSMSKFLSQKMQAEGESNLKRSWVDAQYKVLKGPGQGDVDKIWWKVLNGAQNWIRASALGSASLSALSDTVFLSATAKINGLSSSRALGNYAKVLSGEKNLKDVAKRSGYIVDIVGGSTLSDTRFAGETMPGKFTAALARATNKLSGLHAMTKATQDSIALEFNSFLGENITSQTPWAKLNSDIKATFKKFDFNESDWNSLLRAEVHDTGKGAKFLITNDLRVSDTFDAKTAMSLANKIDDITFSMRQQASNEALLSTRALTTGAAFGDGSPGSMSRAFASSLFMFKTFPITVIMTHTLPAIRRAVSQRKFDHLAQIAIGTTIMGAVPLMLKDAVKGKQIEDPDKYFNPKFLMGAMMQGGGIGLFGDFLFQDYSRFGRGLTAELMGPVAGTVDDVYRATKGNFDRFIDEKDPDFVRDTFKIVKRNIPVVGSLWYTRLAVERLLLDNIERMIDPRFDSRMRKLERKMMEEQGKSFWWKP